MAHRRRIVSCQTCRKRFFTSKGSTLCMSCRPEEPAPKLTYGGDSLPVPLGSARRDATAGAATTMCASNVAHSGGAEQIIAEEEASPRQQTVGAVRGGAKRTLGEITDIGHVDLRVDATSSNAAPSAIQFEEHPVSKKQRVESETSSSDCINESAAVAVPATGEYTAAECLPEIDCKRRMQKTPKVSLGSVTNGGSGSSESEDELDAMIAQDSIWSSRTKSEESTKEVQPSKNCDDDEDSDIECLGTSSEPQRIEEGLRLDEQRWGSGDFCGDYRNESLQETESLGSLFEASDGDDDLRPPLQGGSTALEDGDSCDAGSDGVQTALRPPLPNSPKKEVCYICGSDLSKLSSGLKGRVAHMKRCSSKYGKVLGGRSAMDNDGGFDADFVDPGMKTTTSNNLLDSPSKQASRVVNPYDKSQWHGDAASELELNKSTKQTKLKQFFEKPVRSLTNVLMAGARQVAKGKAIVASKDAKSGKQPYRRGQHWSSRRSGTCPSYKRIPGTDFICDGFHYARQTLSENYFLTHFHSDHYGGITKTWKEGTIYCSLPTANLVHQQLGVDKRFLHPIPMNTPTLIASKGKPVSVTLLDANHCPGAIMFLFEVGNRKILHVGDFRWHRELMLNMPQLRAFSNSSPRLDELFLDTTYCNKKYTLPTQEEAIGAAVEVAEREMAISKKDAKNKTLFLFGSYTIGKERIYLSVAEHLKLKVYVDSRRFRILSALEWPKERLRMFTTNKSETSLWVVPLGSVNFKQMPDYLDEANKCKAFTAPYGRVVGFRPTGWTYSAKDKRQRTLPGGRPPPGRGLISSKTSGRYSVHGVPYSEHSSFPELVDCLRCLKPKKCPSSVKAQIKSCKMTHEVQLQQFERDSDDGTGNSHSECLEKVWRRLIVLNQQDEKRPPVAAPKHKPAAAPTQHKTVDPSVPLVTANEESLVTPYTFQTMQQVQGCNLDNYGNGTRSTFDFGFPGLACRHCAGSENPRRFFYRTSEILSGNYSHIPNHLLACPGVPTEMKKQLKELKQDHMTKKHALNRGAQKLFFQTIWDRLHGK